MSSAEPYLYVASSWRNQHYPLVVQMLRGAAAAAGVTESPEWGVYDFRAAGGSGFAWSECDPDWEDWDPAVFRANLTHPAAERGWQHDKGALDRATACVLVGPCGRSAHLELGYAAGRGLPCAIYLPERQEPELMYRFADLLVAAAELANWAMDVFGKQLAAAGGL